MTGKLTLLAVCCLGAAVAVQGIRLSDDWRRRWGQYADREEAFGFCEPPLEDATGPTKGLRYNHTTWMKKNTASFLRKLGPEHPVEVEGGKVCLIFIPVGTNCKPAVGIIPEKDVHRIRKLGSQFINARETINTDNFMVECVNRIMWLKWMKLEF